MMRLALAAAAFAAVPANATTINFNSGSCSVANCVAPPSNIGMGLIRQDFGDTPAVNVTYSGRAAPGNSGPTTSSLNYWPNGYSNSDIGYVEDGDNSIGEVKFENLLPGNIFTLNSVDIGGFGAARSLQLRIYDLNYSLIDTLNETTNPTALKTIQLGYSSPTGLILQFGLGSGGNGALNAGIQNIIYSAVPEPASWAMLIAGFGLSGAAMRRRRVTAAVA